MGDRQGLPLTATVSAANVNDHRVFEDVVDGVHPVRQPLGRPRKRPGKLHGDNRAQAEPGIMVVVEDLGVGL
jgi:hypothetical protein